MKKERRFGSTTPLQKVLYATGSIGFAFLYMNTTSYMSIYFTDVAKISAAFVGVLMVVARILDAISDMVMGAVIEKTNTKMGKCRPWMLLGGIMLTVGVVLLFNVPSGWSESARSAYSAAMYIFVTVISYTMGYLSYSALLQRFSFEDRDRNVLGVMVGIFSMMANVIIAASTTMLLTQMGGERNQSAWSKITLIYAILGLACILVTFFTIREKDDPAEQENEKRVVKKEGKANLKAAFGLLLKSKYFYVYTLTIFFSVILSTMLASGAQYYVRDVLGDIELYTYVTFCTIPFILVMPIWPSFFRKFGKVKVITAGLILSLVCCLLPLFDVHSFPLLLITVVFRYIGISPLVVSSAGMIGDFLDYTEMKHGVRYTGIVSGASSFGNKLGTGLGAGILLWCLAIGGYDPDLTVQAASAINAEIAFVTWIPAICIVICIITLQFWDLDKYRNELDAFVAAKENKKVSNDV